MPPPPPKPKLRKLTTITKFFTAKPTPTVTATPSPPTTSTVTDSFTVTANVHRADVPNEAADDVVTASVLRPRRLDLMTSLLSLICSRAYVMTYYFIDVL